MKRLANHGGDDDDGVALAHELQQHSHDSQLIQTDSLPSSLPASILSNGAVLASDAAISTPPESTAAAVAHVLVPTAPPALATPRVKKRRTKNFKLREDMAKARGSIDVRIPALDPTTFATWDDFIRAWSAYMGATKTLYRRRSSCTTTAWNSRNRTKKYPVPDAFQYATMAYWCTHGCIQPSRGTGVRAHLHNRFTGCMARITADVVYETSSDNDVTWFIRVRNQIVQHNHKISDEIFQCYANNSSVPDELLLGPSECALDDHTRAGRTLRSLDASTAANDDDDDDETAFEASSRILAELDDDDDANDTAHASTTTTTTAAVARETAAVEERRVQMARTELQPLLLALRRTSPRVIHKRLQDVSEMVAHLVHKWHQDRLMEEHAQSSTRVYAGLLGGAASGDDDEPQAVASASVYSDGPSTLLPHRLGSLSPSAVAPIASDGSTASVNSSSDALTSTGTVYSSSSSDSVAIVVASDDVGLSSRHRTTYDAL